MAQQAGALLAHFRMTGCDVDYGVVAALRVLDALDATSPSVGPPMDVCRVTPDEARHLSVDDVAEVRDRVGHWIERERHALTRLFDG